MFHSHNVKYCKLAITKLQTNLFFQVILHYWWHRILYCVHYKLLYQLSEEKHIESSASGKILRQLELKAEELNVQTASFQ